ncbi:flavodoxin domain-containing protein [Arthrobacter sp. GCM10027362]|uniref:flavodoxin domain-containing protein n=1 Tax=Arthrobacter sp. GCM10027362 TaxID=3273379 RepID=UPI003643A788
MKVTVLFGTETGNAEMAAEDIAEVLGSVVESADVTAMDDYDVRGLADEDLLVIVSSTYGEGELPASAQPFFDALQAERPALAGLRFGVFGLGDSSYDTFNNASTTIAGTLTSLGATLHGAPGVHDASGGSFLTDIAGIWAKEFAATL